MEFSRRSFFGVIGGLFIPKPVQSDIIDKCPKIPVYNYSNCYGSGSIPDFASIRILDSNLERETNFSESN